MNTQDIVVGMIVLNDDELVGRTRLQKQAYLLQRCGADFGLRFTYHHYGPYCFELAGAVEDARAEKRILLEEKPGRHGVSYAIFRSARDAERPACLGALSANRAGILLKQMKQVSDVVLELAATIVFLHDQWHYFDKGKISAVEETKRRKPLKATDERIAKALDLLRKLDLWERTEPAEG